MMFSTGFILHINWKQKTYRKISKEPGVHIRFDFTPPNTHTHTQILPKSW